MIALRAAAGALYQVGTHVTVSLIANVVGIIFSLPLLLLLVILSFGLKSVGAIALSIVLLLGVLPNPGLAGAHVIARDLARHEIVSTSDAWNGIREYWRVATRAYLLSFPVTMLILVNLVFYTSPSVTNSLVHSLAVPLEIFWIVTLVLWVSIHLYVFPLLLEQERASALLAYRNAAVIVLKRPIYTWIIVVPWLALLLVTSITGLAAVIGLTIGVSMQERALVKLLPSMKVS